MRELWNKTSAQWIVVTLAGLTLLFLGIDLNGALGQLAKLQTKEQTLQGETTQLNGEISKLKKEIQQIKTDPSVYVDVARNDYLYLKPDEKLTVILKQESRKAGRQEGGKAGKQGWK